MLNGPESTLLNTGNGALHDRVECSKRSVFTQGIGTPSNTANIIMLVIIINVTFINNPFIKLLINSAH